MIKHGERNISLQQFFSDKYHLLPNRSPSMVFHIEPKYDDKSYKNDFVKTMSCASTENSNKRL